MHCHEMCLQVMHCWTKYTRHIHLHAHSAPYGFCFDCASNQDSLALAPGSALTSLNKEVCIILLQVDTPIFKGIELRFELPSISTLSSHRSDE